MLADCKYLELRMSGESSHDFPPALVALALASQRICLNHCCSESWTLKVETCGVKTESGAALLRVHSIPEIENSV